jgi:hypothetical protein
MSIFLCSSADCTHTGEADAIEIWEILAAKGQEASNQCRWRWGAPAVPPRPPTQNCTSPAFGRECTRLTGQVTLRFAMSAIWITETAASRIDEFLETLGIGNVTEITSDLVVENVGLPTFARAPEPVFFKNLKRVRRLTVLGARQYISSSEDVVFTGFPGMSNLEQINVLTLNRTSFYLLTDFRSLRCVKSMQLLYNVQLLTFEGIHNASLTMQDADDSVVVKGHVALRSRPESLQPFRAMSGCDGGLMPRGTLYIDTLCPDPIESWEALCGILRTSNCTARAPGPPSLQTSPMSPSTPLSQATS